ELQRRGVRLGILTRNDHQLALITLEAIGLGGCFPTEHILGRGEARPKPDPDGLLRIARRWNVTPAELVMVGDYRFDLDCGRAAGSRTVLVNLPENPWPELADWHAADCHALLEQLQTP
ncbi:HAD family hydrolase, partial [Pseudomonas aeruginosa]